MKKIVDLTLPLYDSMPVYPDDPEVEIKQVHFLKSEGWNLSTFSFPSHIGTHVNVPIHMVDGGKTLTDYKVDDFIGKCKLYIDGMNFSNDEGVIFTSKNIDKEICDELIKNPPKFVGLSDKFDFDIDLEKLLLERGIISFENLTNNDLLPESFFFYGIPLNIKSGDGSPIRAFAQV